MKLTAQTLARLREDLEKEKRAKKNLVVCCGPGCLPKGARSVASALEESVRSLGKRAAVRLVRVGCHGLCSEGPLVVVEPDGIFYTRVKPGDSEEIAKGIEEGKPVERLYYRDREKKKRGSCADIPFYARQTRWALRRVGKIDPTDIRQYIASGGYASLAMVLSQMSPLEVVETVSKARIRGRGGAGFDAGRKWRFCLEADGSEKYIIANGDEGDPGAFMDRAIMEGDPHGVLEGLIIGAWAVSARQGFIFVRQEYPLAVENLGIAIAQAREHGLLGENILGREFSFDVKIARGAGAFVCGEETALIASVEGKVGEPRARPPYPAQKGLRGKPTVINNVETLISIPLIIEKGPDWFAALGTEGSKGTKAFCVVGKARHTGLVEVPMGTTLRELIFDVAGGPPEGRKFKAVQTGGPSGGCLPEEKLELAIDYESLTGAGSMMGSGGLIVLDDRNCMVDVARYFVSFLVDESCGKCTPCREGLRQLREVLTRITSGRGRMEDLKKVESIGFALMEGSLCALGKTAANPTRSTLAYFKDEYLEHIEEKFCRAGVCRDLVSFVINEKCPGCALCVKSCPAGCITGKKKEVHVIDQKACTRCGACFDVCKYDSVSITRPGEP